ncbi:TPA: hypothetical protein N5L53_004842, partial [Enterobacter asburiae]|nr:hypothetical protein [Enterobacter asburiae]
STSDRDWFNDWFKREFHPDKTGPYIKDQLFFAVLAARAPLLDELEAAEKRIAELEALARGVKQFSEFQICHYGATEDYAKGYIDCQNNYNKALAAAGIGVKG